MSNYIRLLLIPILTMCVHLATAQAQFIQAPESAASEDTAQGVLIIGDKQINITFAAGALSTSYGKVRALIYLANDAINPFSRELQEQVKRGKRHYVEITVNEEGSIIGFNLSTNIIHNSSLMALNTAPVKLQGKQISGDRITGRIFNIQPVITSFNEKNYKIRINANFSAALLKIGASRSKPEDKKPSAPPTNKTQIEPKPVWENAKTVMDEILQVTGNDILPIYFFFNDVGEESFQFHYRTADDKSIKTIEWNGGRIREPYASSLAQPCPPIPLEDVNLDLVSKIYREVRQKTARGTNISVTLGRRITDGCKKPEWQGIGQYTGKLVMIYYSIDGKQTDIKEYSF